MFTDQDIDECLNKLNQIAQDIDMWDCGLPPPSEALREPIRAMLAKHATAPAVPFCYASVNKQGDVTSTHKRKDSWRTVPLYTAPPEAAPAPTVPQGWKLVPVEPTLAMLDAGLGICGGDGHASAQPNRQKINVAAANYAAMLAAAPAAPPQEQSKCAQCHKPYRKGADTKGCPKCAPGVDVPESEFQKPISAPSQPVTLTQCDLAKLRDTIVVLMLIAKSVGVLDDISSASEFLADEAARLKKQPKGRTGNDLVAWAIDYLREKGQV